MAEARRLPAFPRNDLLEEPALTGRVSELELHEQLGPPTTESASDAFEDPRQFWDLAWPCGLVMGIEYHQLTEELIMHLDAPEVDHAVRHLGVELRNMEPTFESKRDRFDRLNPRPVDGLWSISATQADGEKVWVVRNLAERDARCRCVELELTEPHRRFAVEQANSDR
jgi:hypothetical protein